MAKRSRADEQFQVRVHENHVGNKSISEIEYQTQGDSMGIVGNE